MSEVQVAFLTLEEDGKEAGLSQPTQSSLFFFFFFLNQHPKVTYMVGLLSRVDAQVALQRLQVAKASSTDLTRIRLLTRVD